MLILTQLLGKEDLILQNSEKKKPNRLKLLMLMQSRMKRNWSHDDSFKMQMEWEHKQSLKLGQIRIFRGTSRH